MRKRLIHLAKYAVMEFKTWLEGWEKFGFGKKPEPKTQVEPEHPIDQFDIEQLHDFLVERRVGQLRPHSRFVNEVVWGEQVGAVRYVVTPTMLMRIDRLGRDLEGNLLWYTKKSFQINRGGYGGHERIVAQDMFEHLENVYTQEFDSPQREYDKLKQLTIEMADRVRKTCRPVFMLHKIVENNPNRYMICFELRGQGLENQGGMRVEQMTIDLNYLPREGYIRAMVYTIESPVGRSRNWEIRPAEADLNFLPSQPFDEIIESVAVVMRYY